MVDDAKIERERRWRGHLAAWKSSGLSQAAYCRRQGLTQNDFSCGNVRLPGGMGAWRRRPGSLRCA